MGVNCFLGTLLFFLAVSVFGADEAVEKDESLVSSENEVQSLTKRKPLQVRLRKQFGSVQFSNASKKNVAVGKSQVIRDDLHFEIKPGSQAEFVDGAGNLIVLMGGTKGALQFFAEQQLILLDLKSGTLRVVSESVQPWLSVRTLISSHLIVDQDVALRFDEDTLRVEALVFRGKMDFRASQSEESRLIGEKQKAFFQGVREDGEVVFDFLLHGKKIPKGILSELIPMSEKDQAELKVDSPEKERQAEAERRRIEAMKAKGICQNPIGDFNQCAWTCIGNKKGVKGCPTRKKGISCQRSRCNANGVWSDQLTLGEEAGQWKCQAKPVVGKCDY